MDKLPIITASVLLFLMLAYFGNYNIQQMHSGGFYRTSQETKTLGNVVYYKEGLYATVSVRELTTEFPARQHAKALYINGIGQGSTEIPALRTNFLLSYLPLLIKPEIQEALVIGLGTGMTSGHLSQSAHVKTIEIEPGVVEASSHFNLFNLDVLNNKNHALLVDDGRNYLLRNEEKYDLIVTAPANIWQSFSSNLFSKEYLGIVKEDLGKNGFYVQWVPIYSMSPQDFKNFYKTFSEIFPHNAAFANIRADEPEIPVSFETSELIFIGSSNKFDLDFLNENYDKLPEVSRQYLSLTYLNSGDDIYDLFLFDDEDLKGYADDALVVTDNNLILEFSSAKSVLNQYPKAVVYDINKFLAKEASAQEQSSETR